MNSVAIESKIQILEPENRSEIEQAIEYCKENNLPITTKMDPSRLIALDTMGMLESSKEPYIKITLTGHPDKFIFVHFWVVRFHLLDRVDLAIRYLAKGVTT